MHDKLLQQQQQQREQTRVKNIFGKIFVALLLISSINHVICFSLIFAAVHYCFVRLECFLNLFLSVAVACEKFLMITRRRIIESDYGWKG